MKYTTTHETCDTSDCVNTGWIVESHATRARLTRHSRWQGSRDGAVFVKDIKDGPLTEEQAHELAAELVELLGYPECLRYSKGSQYRGWRCLTSGWIVR